MELWISINFNLVIDIFNEFYHHIWVSHNFFAIYFNNLSLLKDLKHLFE